MMWVYLAIAIACEVIATSVLKATDGFTRPAPTVICIAGYLVAFYFLALSLKTIPVAVAYAIWSAVGISLLAVVGRVAYGQVLEWPSIVGLVLIVIGVALLGLSADVR